MVQRIFDNNEETIRNVSEDKYIVNVSTFDETEENDFHLKCIETRVASKGKKIASAVTNHFLSFYIIDEELSFYNIRSFENSLYTIQKFSAAKAAVEKLNFETQVRR